LQRFHPLKGGEEVMGLG